MVAVTVVLGLHVVVMVAVVVVLVVPDVPIMTQPADVTTEEVVCVVAPDGKVVVTVAGLETVQL
jgi:hypothetical protein